VHQGAHSGACCCKGVCCFLSVPQGHHPEACSQTD
jgi:hypothetical protein